MRSVCVVHKFIVLHTLLQDCLRHLLRTSSSLALLRPGLWLGLLFLASECLAIFKIYNYIFKKRKWHNIYEVFCLGTRWFLWFRMAVISVWLFVALCGSGCGSPGPSACFMRFVGCCRLLRSLLHLLHSPLHTRLLLTKQQWHTVAEWDSALQVLQNV